MAKSKRSKKAVAVKVEREIRLFDLPQNEDGSAPQYLPETVAAGAAIMVAGRDSIAAARGAERKGETFITIIKAAKDAFLRDALFDNSAFEVAHMLADILTVLYREEKAAAVAAADAAGHDGATRQGFIRDWCVPVLAGLRYAKTPILELVGGKEAGATLEFDWRETNSYVLIAPITSTCTTETDEKPTDEKPTDEKPTDEKPTDEKPTDEKPAESRSHAAPPEAACDKALKVVSETLRAQSGIVPAIFAAGILSAALRNVPTTGGQLPGVVEWLREIVGAIEADVRAEGVGPMRAEWIAARAKAQADAEAARLRKLANAEAEALAHVDAAKAEAVTADAAYAEAAAKAEAAPDSRKAAKAAAVARQSAEDAGYRLAQFVEAAKAAKAARLAG